jgi:hypothetical protein
MAELIQKAPCIKKYVKKGFLDEYEVTNMFERTKVAETVKGE